MGNVGCQMGSNMVEWGSVGKGASKYIMLPYVISKSMVII